MIVELRVEGYQSLHSVSLRLEKFTVVTGATGSGKSSAIRALELVCFNARGTGYISHGAKTCKVRVVDWPPSNDVVVCELERGGRGRDSYVLVPHRDRVAQDSLVFTKLGGKVPAEVSSALAMSPLNFSRQFDKPFLLDASGGEVAKVLGELTNVTLIFGAAREAARRRLRIEDRLKDAGAELARLRAEAQRFAGLKARSAALAGAQQALASAQQGAVGLQRLSAAISQAQQAQAVLGQVVVPAVPGTAELDASYTAWKRLSVLLGDVVASRHDAQLAADDAETADAARRVAEGGLHAVLAAAGICPTCGQKILPEGS